MPKQDNPNPSRVLIVESDLPTLQLLSDHLASDGFLPREAGSADVARRKLDDLPDLILLDLSVVGALDLLKDLREECPGAGVIVVSSRDTERVRVQAMTAGADDYVVKPFSYGELLARINSVLRRIRREGRSVLTAGPVTINTVEKTVKVEGRVVRLSVKEYALLVQLASEPSRVFSKEELLREIWGYRAIGHTRTLDAHASRLARKLDPDGGSLVLNCWGVGYRLVGAGEGVTA